MEVCIGCGIRAEQHPMVAIMAESDVEAHQYATLEQAIERKESNGTKWAAMAVCDPCWKNPKPGVKGHYQHRKDLKAGLAAAGSNSITKG